MLDTESGWRAGDSVSDRAGGNVVRLPRSRSTVVEILQPRFGRERFGIFGSKSRAPDPQGLPKRGPGLGRGIAVHLDLDVGEAVERESDFRVNRTERGAIKRN